MAASIVWKNGRAGLNRFAAMLLNQRSSIGMRMCSTTNKTPIDGFSNGHDSDDEQIPVGPLTPPAKDGKTATKPKSIKKSVFISQSYDVYTNLALEDWIYKNYDFENHHVLLLWANDPCVVIGRHQNPFNETNVSKLQRNGLDLARRNSGGGTVYHDRGNLNCTFYTARERYDRNYNLNIITRALFREWGINAQISPRDDITLSGKKVSDRCVCYLLLVENLVFFVLQFCNFVYFSQCDNFSKLEWNFPMLIHVCGCYKCASYQRMHMFY